MNDFKINIYPKIGAYYVIDVGYGAFQRITRILRHNKIRFDITSLNDGFRLEIKTNETTLLEIIELCEVIKCSFG